jgi:non-ribosomal peptide synthase protein (TIGR01720 family)
LLKYGRGRQELGGAKRVRGVSFNYLGQLDQVLEEGGLFGAATEGVGRTQSEKNQRSYLLEINGAVRGGRLGMSWAYSEKVHRRETVERLAEGFVEVLRELIEHCRGMESREYTPSDFGLVNVSQGELDELLSDINT